MKEIIHTAPLYLTKEFPMDLWKSLRVQTCDEFRKAIYSFAQVLLYGQLMQELDVPNVRELEDFLINECMYAVRTISFERVFTAQMREID
ncbi:hypothetical protein P8452_22360 [Trifolium repens]|nr:hypothetical protein P8452_22360 [Trifolium repens]